MNNKIYMIVYNLKLRFDYKVITFSAVCKILIINLFFLSNSITVFNSYYMIDVDIFIKLSSF